jgi:hypothetical protein
MLRRTRQALRNLAWPGDDRRTHDRHVTDVQTVCRPLTGDVSLPTRIRNVSRTGASLVVDQTMPEGTMLRVNLPGSPGGPHTTILACVMHTREVGAGEWALGCMFSLELSSDEMQLLGGEKTAAGRDDQRAWVRSPAKGAISFRLLPAEDEVTRTAELLDLSPGGVGLIVHEKIEPGAGLTLDLLRTAGKPDRPMLACVVYSTDRPDGKWAAGCQFLRELTETELKELVWRSIP